LAGLVAELALPLSAYWLFFVGGTPSPDGFAVRNVIISINSR